MIQMREREQGPIFAARNGHRMTCEEFQGKMADLMGGDIREHEHLKSCARCSALLEELESIAEAAKALLPVYEPSDRIWEKIHRSMGAEHDADADASDRPVLPKH